MKQSRRSYLVTGGAGFIGSNFIRHLAASEPSSRIVNLDALTYAAVPGTLDDLNSLANHTFVHGDIRDPDAVSEVMRGIDIVVHFAAESHVDRSIANPTTFVETNVVGTGVLLAQAVVHGIDLFLHVSTDEVYGSISAGSAAEDALLRPSSPYAASKAGSDLLALSYGDTYGLNVIVTRCTNNYGPYQYPEKLIPLFVTRLLEGRQVPLYGDGFNERDWLHVEDHCTALSRVVQSGLPGEIYNIGADAQKTNLIVAKAILGVMELGEDRIEYVDDRPGHDRRYAVDSSRIRRLGWSPQHRFEDRIVETIAWYRDNDTWWRAALGGAT